MIPAMRISEKEINEFIGFAHRLGEAGLTNCSSGNVSRRSGDLALVSGTGSWVPSLKRGNVAVCEVATGKVIAGPRPSMETGFHLGVMRERPDVQVVAHFQSPYATAVACMKNPPHDFNVTAEIPCHPGSVIPHVPYYRPGSPELAEAVKGALRNADAALMLKHGQVVCGKSYDEVLEKAVFFEMAARIIILTRGEYNTLTPAEIADLEHYINGKK